MELDLVVAVLGGGPEPGVAGGDLLVEQRGQDASTGLEQGGDAGLGGAGVGAVLQVLRRGPKQHVPKDGGRDQHPFRGRRGHRQDDRAQQWAGELVEDEELAAPRRHGEAVVVAEAVDEV